MYNDKSPYIHTAEVLKEILSEASFSYSEGKYVATVVDPTQERSILSSHPSIQAASEAVQNRVNELGADHVGYVEHYPNNVKVPESQKGMVVAVHVPKKSWALKPFDAIPYKERHERSKNAISVDRSGRKREYGQDMPDPNPIKPPGKYD